MGSMSHSRSDRIAYRASKAAVNKVMQGLASDLAAEGIAVAVAHPGWVRTDMGGSGADISPDESARGLSGVIDALKPNPAGAFFNWSGEALPW
jgi:NAD(P)-dependent dehydrogenase (short-subunit alcohol dehydrogenase family)